MTRKIVFIALLLLAVVLPLGGAYALTRPSAPHEIRAALSVSEALEGSGAGGFTRALEPRAFSFPSDHGPHPDFGIEWWYYTGNLDTTEGRHFGFELTFFRIGLASNPAERDSAWGASQLYMAHFALTDVENNRFYSFERFSREALGLAGAQAQPFHVWLEDWAAEGAGQEALPVQLRAAEGEVAIDLTLDSAKPVVLHGEGGLSRKSAPPGNASYYYSLTRMPTRGTLRLGEKSFEVSGTSWMDREWSTASLAENQVGWDWFALQLSDGREVMFYQLRLREGGSDPFSSGTLVMPDGSARHLGRDDVQLEALDLWQSRRGGAPYPSRWRVRVPSETLDIELTPYIKDQELDVSVRYWEGAVKIEGSANGAPISGVGYVEMTGYASDPGGRS